MKNQKVFLSALLTLFVLSFSCSKDDEPEVKEFETIGFDSVAIIEKLPEGLKNSDNEYAEMAVDYVENAIDWSSFSDQLVPPENAVKTGKKSSETYTWTWNYGGAYVLTLWWTFHDDSEKNYWDIDIQYNEGERYSYLQAWEAKDNSSGQIQYNFQWACSMDDHASECEDLFWIYTWDVDENENYTFKYIIEADDDSYNESLRYETVVNNDGSGYVRYYFYEELFYDLNWDQDGNGSWTYYFGGDSGSWTVG